MSLAESHHHIQYVEFHSTDIERTKQFYAKVFAWSFVDYGPDYVSFTEASAGINGGFAKGEASTSGPLIVLYSKDLGATEEAIIDAGGTVTIPTFVFPGGRRFHFSDGAGNVLAVWSE
jgi:predicted enzyme related to lactoylglutathione lyase